MVFFMKNVYLLVGYLHEYLHGYHRLKFDCLTFIKILLSLISH